MKQKLKEHALKVFDYYIAYYDAILKDFPEDRMEEAAGEAETPLHLLKHVGGTAGWWMKRRGTRFDFSSSLNSVAEFKQVVKKQREAFAKFLEDDDELYWSSETDPKPTVPWIMIRSVNHALHHGGMLILYRHIFGLPPLDFGDGPDWGEIVDLPGEIHYSELHKDSK